MSQNAIKLSAWAKQKGLTYKGAWRMFKAGDLPCHSEQLPSGTILVYPDEPSKALGKDRVALYSRVSPPKTDEDLDQQLDRLRNFAAAKGLCVDVEMSDIWNGVDLAPGPDQTAISLCEILDDHTIKTVVVENRDRLPPFSADIIEAALKGAGRTLLVASKVVTKMSKSEFDAILQDAGDRYLYGPKKNYLIKQMKRFFRDWDAVLAEQERSSKNFISDENTKPNKLIQVWGPTMDIGYQPGWYEYNIRSYMGPGMIWRVSIPRNSQMDLDSPSEEMLKEAAEIRSRIKIVITAADITERTSPLMGPYKGKMAEGAEKKLIETPQILLSSYQRDLIGKVHLSVEREKTEIFAVRWPRQSGKKQALAVLLMPSVRGGHSLRTVLYGDENSYHIIKDRLQTFGMELENLAFVSNSKDILVNLHQPDLVIVCSQKRIDEGRIKQILQHCGNCTMVFIVSADQYPEIKTHSTSTSEWSVAEVLADRREDFETTGNPEYLKYEENVLRQLPKELQ